MSRYRYKPSKPVALLGAVVGAAVLVFGVVGMLSGDAADDGLGIAFLVLWCAAGVCVIGFNLWAAFAEKGSLATFSRVEEDDPAR
ncbi:hypothetical protein [Blastococcus xanthinilyticus]|uniref:Uncharacterized protein n=1 Tax=Blastococcus xanthinilyticus TaxID=1564164 RepID=A0A5S5CZG7_9ACTN|nr:hypothetical protein [Blastococcus xanthinilyticus]TYP89157.1 hypothetical protein BD833_103314 [Blastococcus xanthinilyticus]